MFYKYFLIAYIVLYILTQLNHYGECLKQYKEDYPFLIKETRINNSEYSYPYVINIINTIYYDRTKKFILKIEDFDCDIYDFSCINTISELINTPIIYNKLTGKIFYKSEIEYLCAHDKNIGIPIITLLVIYFLL